jgi:hypothetical protein
MDTNMYYREYHNISSGDAASDLSLLHKIPIVPPIYAIMNIMISPVNIQLDLPRPKKKG